MGISIYQVDAFTNDIFRGNPAAVCLLHNASDDDWMQRVAAEMNLSETAFLYPLSKGFHLRWFTPKTEVELCGHATLASAHVLWETGILGENEEAIFHTRGGVLTARHENGWIEMDFPSCADIKTPTLSGLSAALGVEPSEVHQYGNLLLAQMETEEVVRSISPNFSLISHFPVSGIIVTAEASSDGYDFVSRVFAPKLGINEDPVTGSAHCCLAAFWKPRLKRDDFIAYQASQRGGVLSVRVHGDRVLIAGQAVTVFVGVLI